MECPNCSTKMELKIYVFDEFYKCPECGNEVDRTEAITVQSSDMTKLHEEIREREDDDSE